MKSYLLFSYESGQSHLPLVYLGLGAKGRGIENTTYYSPFESLWGMKDERSFVQGTLKLIIFVEDFVDYWGKTLKDGQALNKILSAGIQAIKNSNLADK